MSFIDMAQLTPSNLHGSTLINPFVILRDQPVHFPDLKEPGLVVLLDDFPGLLVDADEYLI